jgi:hypothetical protein
VSDYDEDDNQLLVEVPDYPHVDLGGGADPYSFDILFHTTEGEYLERYRPEGIVLGGQRSTNIELPAPAGGQIAGFPDGASTIRSYAIYQSTTPASPIYIAAFSMDPSSVSCEVTRTRVGKGKNAYYDEYRRIRATAIVTFEDASGLTVEDLWADAIFAVHDGDLYNPTYLESGTSTPSGEYWENGVGVGATMDGGAGTIQLQLAVHYVFGTDFIGGHAYDPTQNTYTDYDEANPWYTLNTAPITAPGSWPVALTQPFSVECAGK